MITARIVKPAAQDAASSRYANDPKLAAIYWRGVSDGRGGEPCLVPVDLQSSRRADAQCGAWYDGWRDGSDQRARKGR